jgi:hypothetical protein
MLFILDVDYTICITCIMYQQLWGYKVEEKLYLGVREQKRLNTTDIDHRDQQLSRAPQVARRKMAEHARLCFKATSWQESVPINYPTEEMLIYVWIYVIYNRTG